MSFTYLLSFLHDVLISKTSSPNNSVLEVVLSKGRYRLNTANATYSYEDLYDVFFKAFQRLAFQKRALKNVLVLGTGLGSVPLILQKKFGRKAHFVCVDIDNVVIDLAKQYLPSEVVKNTTFVVADAMAFVIQAAQNKDVYDCIVVDLFIDDSTPAIFRSKPFLEQCKNLLPPKGMLLYNVLSNTKEHQKIGDHFWINYFLPIFPNSKVLESPSNKVFFFEAL